MCGGSPLIDDRGFLIVFRLLFRVGEITQERSINYYSHSPLSEPELVLLFLFFVDVGEITQERSSSYVLSFSPL